LSKVMIVDDDVTTVTLLETLLELDGFDVTIVKRGTEVITRAEQVMPDVIMIDYNLNDTDGITVVKDLRQHPTLAGVPIVMASGLDVSEDAIAAGANQFLVKPFEPDELPKIFNTLISG
jgi:CheY-like chemotaxis protein